MKNQPGSRAELAVVLALSWVSFFVFLPLGLIFWLICLFKLAHRRSRLTYWCFGASPYVLVPVVTALLTLAAYFTGTALYLFVGLPGGRSFNLDKERRCYRRSVGCVAALGTGFVVLPNNWVLDAAVATLGPMPGTYHGPYPSETEAYAAIEAQGTVLGYGELLGGRFVVDGQQVDLTDDPCRVLTKGGKNWWYRLTESEPVRVALYAPKCLLVEGRSTLGGDIHRLRMLALVDLEHQEVFATYNRAVGQRR